MRNFVWSVMGIIMELLLLHLRYPCLNHKLISILGLEDNS